MDFLRELEEKLKAAMADLREELASVRGSRATPKLVEDIKVNYLDGVFLVKQLGSISIGSPREVVVNVWDTGAADAVARAIEESSSGTTAVSGAAVRVSLPVLTEERKRELVKLVKSAVESSRIRIRHLRDENNKKVVADFESKKIGEDEKFRLKKEIQKIVDERNEETERILENKIKEINE